MKIEWLKTDQKGIAEMPYWVNYGLALILVLSFFWATFAEADTTRSYAPDSPREYTGAEDIVFNCGATGNFFWTFFRPDGVIFQVLGAWQTGSGCGGDFATFTGFTFQQLAGSFGDVKALYWENTGGPALAACYTIATATYSTCTASASWINAGEIEDTYELCDGPCPAPPSPVVAGTVSYVPWLLALIPLFIVVLFLLHVSKPAERFLASMSPSPGLKKLFAVNYRTQRKWYD